MGRATAIIFTAALSLLPVQAEAKDLPECYVVVVADQGKETSYNVLYHENFHCWGWHHGPHEIPTKIDPKYRAAVPPLRYRIKGWYPKNKLIVYFEKSKDVARMCDGNAYGCILKGGLF